MVACAALFFSSYGAGKATTSRTTTSLPVTTSAVTTTTPFPGDLPSWAAGRMQLPDCGYLDGSTRLPTDRLPADEQRKLDCFWSAHDARHPAELRALEPTIDAAAVPHIYRFIPDGQSEDIYRTESGVWTSQKCAVFRRDPQGVTCVYGLDAQNYLATSTTVKSYPPDRLLDRWRSRAAP